MAAKTVSFKTDPKVHDCNNRTKSSKLMGLFTRRNCVKRTGSTDSARESTVTSSSRYGNRRMSMIQEMQSQLPRLSLFEIHVNNSNKTPPAKPITKPKTFRVGNSISLWLECFDDYCTARNLQSRSRVTELIHQLDTYALKILSEYARLKYNKEMNYTTYYGSDYDQLYQDLLFCLDENLINQMRLSEPIK